MVDREARDKLADLIESFLDERLTAHEFEEAIEEDEVVYGTDDKTVHQVAFKLWLFYTDGKDHTVAVPKEGWGYLQRLLLLLRSDAHVRMQPRRIWSWRQAVAAITLICFLAVAIPMGFGYHLFVVAVPFGLISIAIADQFRKLKDEDKEAIALSPFASITDLLRVRRQVPGFRKRRYLAELEGKEIRGRVAVAAIWSIPIILWLVFSPAALAFQLFPVSDKRMAIET